MWFNHTVLNNWISRHGGDSKIPSLEKRNSYPCALKESASILRLRPLLFQSLILFWIVPMTILYNTPSFISVCSLLLVTYFHDFWHKRECFHWAFMIAQWLHITSFTWNTIAAWLGCLKMNKKHRLKLFILNWLALTFLTAWVSGINTCVWN